jgi:ABC-type oligopeptide transport system substrate-binding subunit/serine/threonine protein kinase
MRQNDFEVAAQYARRQIEIDNFREAAHRQLMEALALSGQRPEALSHYETYRTLLIKELGADPSGGMVDLVGRILDGDLVVDTGKLPLGRGYELKEEIGAGAYGVVHRAFQPAAGRDVAVKIILPKYADQPDFAARFDAEAQLVARLEHPHIVPLYDTWRDENGAHLVMRLLRGGTLKDLLKTGPMGLEAAVKLVEQIASALDAAHQEGIIHRDLKPSNILFDKRGNAYLSDFGIAKNLAAEVTLTPTGAVIGTPDYIAPEQIRGEELTSQADQYSLGLVLFEVLTGFHPFSGESIATLFHKHLTVPLPLVSAIQPDMPPEIDSVIQRATAKHPADRYTSVSELSTALRRALATSDQRPTPSPQPPAPSPQPSVPTLPAFLETSDDRPTTRPPFVAREREMGRLAEFLAAALAQEGQASDQGTVVFVAGDAGSGKTSLMRAFAEQAQTVDSDLLVAWGACNAFTGRGDPYLPFRDIMSALSGDVESSWRTGTITGAQARRLWKAMPQAVETVIDHGPVLIDTFVSGSSLLSRTTSALPEESELLGRLRQQVGKERPVPGEMGQSELFQQLATVLCRLSEENPILLVVDDLQWADSGTINILFHLGRRLAGSRILLLCAYRPEDLVSEQGKRHPLQPLLDEFKRHLGDVWIDLNRAEGLTFINQFIDSEPNKLSDIFRRTLFTHTDGHPLFTVELLRDLQERGDLVRDDSGSWIEGSWLDWSTLPARVEGVIEERIGRLEDELREILTVAAVEGEDFTAEVVARVQEIQERQLMRALSVELDKRHQLVRERQPIQVGDNLLTRYRFTHTLFQRYLYNELSGGEKRLLHGEIARLLEELYSGRTEDICVQLARHYTEAGDGERAVNFLLLAGDKARSLYAHQEAIDHYQRALVFLKERGRHEQAARTLMKLGLTYHVAMDFHRSRQAYDEAFASWHQAEEEETFFHVPPAPHALRLYYVEPATLDPTMVLDVWSADVISQLFDGLVTLSLDGDVLPDVARSWELLEEGRKYLFHLNNDIRWSDGVPLTAKDFEYAWKRLLHPSTGSPMASLLYDLEGARAFHQGETTDPTAVGVRALDDLTLEVNLESPTGYFLHLLAVMYPIPSHVIEEHGEAWTDEENIVTFGPFRLDSWHPGKSIVLRRNPEYRGRRGGNLQAVELYFTGAMDSWTEKLERYESDKLDYLGLPVAEGDLARQRHAGDFVEVPTPHTTMIVMDVSRPPFDDLRVRQAFALAIDRDALCNIILKGHAPPASGGLVPPGIPGHSAGIGLGYDPEQAKKLMAEAGYPGGSRFPAVDAMTWLQNEPDTSYLAAQWDKVLGIKISWELIELDVYIRVVFSKPKHIRLHSWTADYPDPDSFLRTGHINLSNWRNVKYNSLIEKARRTMEQEKRIELYKKADRILIEEAAIVPLTYGSRLWLVKPWVRKMGFGQLTRFNMKDIVIEPH